jgi:PKD repeat protein
VTQENSLRPDILFRTRSAALLFAVLVTGAIARAQTPGTTRVSTTSHTLTCSAAVPSFNMIAPVEFVGSATPADRSGTTTYSWTFGDGTNGVGQNQTHVYRASGTYPWSFTATNGATTCSETGIISIDTGVPCQPMVANQNVYIFYVDDSGLCAPNGGTCLAGRNITFTVGTFGINLNCAVHSFSWDFGDSKAATGRQVIHAFAAPGTYNVVLTIASPNQSVQVPASVSIFRIKPRVSRH